MVQGLHKGSWNHWPDVRMHIHKVKPREAKQGQFPRENSFQSSVRWEMPRAHNVLGLEHIPSSQREETSLNTWDVQKKLPKCHAIQVKEPALGYRHHQSCLRRG